MCDSSLSHRMLKKRWMDASDLEKLFIQWMLFFGLSLMRDSQRVVCTSFDFVGWLDLTHWPLNKLAERLHGQHFVIKLRSLIWLKCFLRTQSTVCVTIFSCDQAYVRTVQSIWPSGRLTCFIMYPSLHHHWIFRSYYPLQKWCPCNRLRSQVKGQGHIWQNPI